VPVQVRPSAPPIFKEGIEFISTPSSFVHLTENFKNYMIFNVNFVEWHHRTHYHMETRADSTHFSKKPIFKPLFRDLGDHPMQFTPVAER